jgi:hypothetical protein
MISRRQPVEQTSMPQPQPWPPARKAPAARHGQKRKIIEVDIEVGTPAPGSPVPSGPRRSKRASSSTQMVYIEDSDEDAPAVRRGDEVEDDYDPSNDLQEDSLIQMEDDFLDEMRIDVNGLQVKFEPEEPVIPSSPAPKTIDEMIEEDFEDKPKMVSLSYSDFEIPGRYLCVIVEPYPPLPKEALRRAKTLEPPEVRFRAPSAIPRLRETSVTPNPLLASDRGTSVTPAVRFRSVTPLFLPADDERDRTPAPTAGPSGKTIPSIPLFNYDYDEDDEPDLLAFSQALANVPRGGGGFDGGDEDSEYLRGDADEVREG